jgi:hypothetical protein
MGVRYGLVFLGILILFACLIAYPISIARSAAQVAAVTNATNLALVLESKIHSTVVPSSRSPTRNWRGRFASGIRWRSGPLRSAVVDGGEVPNIPEGREDIGFQLRFDVESPCSPLF